jgi:C1A family cysteine protease
MSNYKMGWKYNQIDNIDTQKKFNLGLDIDDIDNLDKNEIDNHATNTELIKYDLYEKYKDFFPEIVDQGNIESCVPTCISTIYYYLTMKQSNYSNFRISRLYLYYQVRKLYNDINNDNGSTIFDCINILHNDGVIPEFFYPYNHSNLYKNPEIFLEKYAKCCKCLGFESVKRNQIKNKLLMDYPIICGIKIFKNINDDEIKKTGIIKLYIDDNDDNDDNLVGGHCIILVGFDDNTRYFKFINSWGNKWGENGFGYLPYEYISNKYLSDEFYILNKITNPIINLEQKDDNFIDKINKGFKKLFD